MDSEEEVEQQKAEEEESQWKQALSKIQARAEHWANLPEETKEEIRRQREAELEAEAAAEKTARIRMMLERIPPRYQQANIVHLGDRGREAVRKFVAELYQGGSRGLVLAGPTGTGKTYAMWAAYRLLVETDLFRDPDAIQVHKVVALLSSLRPNSDGDVEMNVLKKCPVLFLDDLAVQKASDWVTERLYEIVDTRYDAMLPVVVTTNLAGAELSTRVDDRIVSRLYEMCDVVEAGGKDRRRGA